jgi:hypothetical protein
VWRHRACTAAKPRLPSSGRRGQPGAQRPHLSRKVCSGWSVAWRALGPVWHTAPAPVPPPSVSSSAAAQPAGRTAGARQVVRRCGSRAQLAPRAASGSCEGSARGVPEPGQGGGAEARQAAQAQRTVTPNQPQRVVPRAAACATPPVSRAARALQVPACCGLRPKSHDARAHAAGARGCRVVGADRRFFYGAIDRKRLYKDGHVWCAACSYKVHSKDGRGGQHPEFATTARPNDRCPAGCLGPSALFVHLCGPLELRLGALAV